MKNAKLANPGRTAAIVLSAATLLAVGCASQGDVANSAEPPQPCPRNMTLECFDRPTRPKQCSCITAQELEQTMEQVLGR